MTEKSRFIAGAVCPICQSKDKIKLHQDSFPKKIECIACGFNQVQPIKNN